MIQQKHPFDFPLLDILKLNAELAKEFNKAISISELKENDTIDKLEQFFTKENQVQIFNKQKEYPIMENQMGVFVESLNDNTTKYNIPVLFKLDETLDITKLKDALIKVGNLHYYLKSTITSKEDGSISFIRDDDLPIKVDVFEVDKLVKEDLVRPFVILNSPLYRFEIYKSKVGNYLFIDVHHLIADGTSMGILIADLNKVYRGEDVEKEKFSTYEIALSEKERLNSNAYNLSLDYYDKLLSSCNTDLLPNKSSNNKEAMAVRETYPFAYSREINDFVSEHNLSLNAFFNAVFAYTLLKFNHSDDLTYCTVYNGRNDSRFMNCFGMLVKTLPVRVILNEEEEILNFINNISKQLIESMANDIVAYSTLSNKYEIKPDIFFTYQGDNFVFDKIGDKKAEAIELSLNSAKAKLSIEISVKNNEFILDVNYEANYFAKEFIESFIDSLKCVANEFTRCLKLKDIKLISGKQKEYYALMNDTKEEIKKVNVVGFIEEIARSSPEKIAVKTINEVLTYKELDQKANIVANELLKLGVKQNDIIGLMLDRNSFIPIGECAIYKASAAFLPVPPSFPDERLDFCFTDAACKYVLTSKDVIESHQELFTNKAYKALAIEELLLGKDLNKPDVAFDFKQLAYCIYTSGSTGKPKGVLIEQHNHSNYVQTNRLKETVLRGHNLICMSSISFDLSIIEIFLSLSYGRTIYIASEEEIHNLDLLLQAFKKNDIDYMMATPSFAYNLLSLKEFEEVFAKLKALMLGAEVFPAKLFAKFKSLNKDMFIQNGYGPTECSQACSSKEIVDEEDINIGGPFKNTEFYVCDTYRRLLPRYAVGELLILGEGVGRGYVNLPEKNKTSFIEINGKRAYCSGDLVRFNKQNEIEFSGRADNQVKLRGYRIELDEIERTMQEFEGISQSKVIVRNNGNEDYLAAFFVANKEIDIASLTSFMKEKLTYYMVPGAFRQLDKMPMTASGKLDKKALPETNAQKKTRTKKAPKKSLEEKILELFISTLNIEEAYVDDNFFDIGGTSISASKVCMRLKSEGYKIEYQDIFDYQTAEELAKYLENQNMIISKVQDESTKIKENKDEFAELLKYNCLEYADQVTREDLGDVLLTGAAGFLGTHILKILLESEKGKIICPLRKGKYDDVITRLKTSLVYYFEDDCAKDFNERIVVLEADITDENLADKLKEYHFDTVINCAALVKHYASDNSIEFVNVGGVVNLIKLCKEKDAKLIQISTASVPGAHTEKTYANNLKMYENQLFVIDDLNNQYAKSKYKAEVAMLNAIKQGMRGKIIRVGNLMGRYSDGEFQSNMHTNAFLNGVRGFVHIGKCPISHATDQISFSPIDLVAKAVVLLSGTNDMFTAFNVESRSTIDEMKLIEAINRCGIKITPVDDKEYYDDFNKMMADPEQNEKVRALLTNDRPDLHMVEVDNRFTANILYRLGFSWPFIDDRYLERLIQSLDSLDFFYME